MKNTRNTRDFSFIGNTGGSGERYNNMGINNLYCRQIERGEIRLEDVPENRREEVQRLYLSGEYKGQRSAASKVKDAMAHIYCRQIQRGRKTIQDVPEKHRAAARRILESGKV